MPGDDETCLFEVVFDHGEHDAAAPTPTDDASWLCRQDPFSTYRSTFEIRTYRLCRRVLMFHRFPELGENPVLVRSIDFTYENISSEVREKSPEQLDRAAPKEPKP